MDASMKAFDDAVALEPNRADAFVGKAHVYLALGQVSPVTFHYAYADIFNIARIHYAETKGGKSVGLLGQLGLEERENTC